MKILLDECLPIDFRHSFVGHEAHALRYAGLKCKQSDVFLSTPGLAEPQIERNATGQHDRLDCSGRDNSHSVIRDNHLFACERVAPLLVASLLSGLCKTVDLQY